jgi:hypothetical protein
MGLPPGDIATRTALRSRKSPSQITRPNSRSPARIDVDGSGSLCLWYMDQMVFLRGGALYCDELSHLGSNAAS